MSKRLDRFLSAIVHITNDITNNKQPKEIIMITITHLKKRAKQLFYLGIAGLVLTACSEAEPDISTKATSQTNPDQQTIRIGTSPGDFADMVRDYIGPELEKAGYQVTLKEITDIVIPNTGVHEGSLEVNIFQHKP